MADGYQLGGRLQPAPLAHRHVQREGGASRFPDGRAVEYPPGPESGGALGCPASGGRHAPNRGCDQLRAAAADTVHATWTGDRFDYQQGTAAGNPELRSVDLP